MVSKNWIHADVAVHRHQGALECVVTHSTYNAACYRQTRLKWQLTSSTAERNQDMEHINILHSFAKLTFFFIVVWSFPYFLDLWALNTHPQVLMKQLWKHLEQQFTAFAKCWMTCEHMEECTEVFIVMIIIIRFNCNTPTTPVCPRQPGHSPSVHPPHWSSHRNREAGQSILLVPSRPAKQLTDTHPWSQPFKA